MFLLVPVCGVLDRQGISGTTQLGTKTLCFSMYFFGVPRPLISGCHPALPLRTMVSSASSSISSARFVSTITPVRRRDFFTCRPFGPRNVHSLEESFRPLDGSGSGVTTRQDPFKEGGEIFERGK